ncbi:hypothetical protein C8J57DRAFT_1721253 [Mycena rebaudengoi]|nr:hypothetical protein C8J57DRAFT_1721253 [Mycena rebaudengoi]
MQDPRGMNVDNAPAAGTLMRAHTPGGISNLRAVVLELSLGSIHLEQATLRVPSSKSCPILTIPTEIMSEIFITFLPAYPERPPATGRFSLRFWNRSAGIGMRWHSTLPGYGEPLKYTSAWEAPWMHNHNQMCSPLGSRDRETVLCLSSSKQTPILPPPHFTAALLSHSKRWEHITLIIPFDLRWLEGLDRPFLCYVT